MNTIPYFIGKGPRLNVRTAKRQLGFSPARRKAEQAIYDKLHAQINALWLETRGKGWSRNLVAYHQWAYDDAGRALAKLALTRRSKWPFPSV